MLRFGCLALILLSACQIPGQPQRQAQSTTQNAYFADLKSPSQAQIQVRVRIQRDFAVQSESNQDGQAPAAVSEIESFQVMLIESASLPSGGEQTLFAGPFTMPVNLNSNTQDFTFDHVPPGSYYVCASAFADATPSSSSNLTDPQTPYRYSHGSCIISTTGGVSDSGRMQVNSDFSVSGSSELGVELALKSGQGALIKPQIKLVVVDDD